MEAYCSDKDSCRRKIFYEKFTEQSLGFTPCRTMCDNCRRIYSNQHSNHGYGCQVPNVVNQQNYEPSGRRYGSGANHSSSSSAFVSAKNYPVIGIDDDIIDGEDQGQSITRSNALKLETKPKAAFVSAKILHSNEQKEQLLQKPQPQRVGIVKQVKQDSKIDNFLSSKSNSSSLFTTASGKPMTSTLTVGQRPASISTSVPTAINRKHSREEVLIDIDDNDQDIQFDSTSKKLKSSHTSSSSSSMLIPNSKANQENGDDNNEEEEWIDMSVNKLKSSRNSSTPSSSAKKREKNKNTILLSDDEDSF
jgi:hypothetical protein